MIKPGYTYRAMWAAEPVIVYVARRNRAMIEIEHLTGRLQDRTVTIKDKDRPDWVEVCEGRHSNPDALLTQTPEGDPEPLLTVGTVRIGKMTKARYEVLAIHGERVWTVSTGGNENGGGTCDWKLPTFLASSVEAPTFFEEGHDYEYLHGAGPRLRVTVRRVGKMPMGAWYAVVERRNGMRQGDPMLLTQDDFKRYEDVTK